jgi:methyl-accepting chemotaxis protein
MKKANYIDDTPVPVIVMDCDHNIEHMNGAAAMLAGRTVDACIGLKMWEVFDMAPCRTNTCLAARAIREGCTVSGETECLVQGQMTSIRSHVSPRFDEQHKIIGVVEVIEDNSQDAKLSQELARVAKAAREGHFKERAKMEQFQGGAQNVLREVNVMLDANLDKLNWFQSILDAVPYPVQVLDKDMNWIFLNLAFEKLMIKSSAIKTRSQSSGKPCSTSAESICNTPNCGVVQLNKGVGETYFDWYGQNCKQATSKLVNVKGEHIGYVEVVQDLTSTVRNKDYTACEVKRLAGNLTKLSQGDFVLDLQVKEADQYTTEAKQHFDKINESLGVVKSAVQALAMDADALTKAAVDGDLTVRADASKHQGDFRKIVQGINRAFETIAVPLGRAVEHLDKLSRGINGEQITRTYKGELQRLTDAFNKVFATVGTLVADSTMLAQAGAEGKLSNRADALKHEGDFRKIVQGFNSTLDSVVGPMQDVGAVLTKLAGGDFTAEVTNKYAGDYEHLSHAVNTLSQSVRSALGQIGRNVASIAVSAEELNRVSQSMGSNADETAPSSPRLLMRSARTCRQLLPEPTRWEPASGRSQRVPPKLPELRPLPFARRNRQTKPSPSWGRVARKSVKSSRSLRPSLSRPTCWPSMPQSRRHAPARQARDLRW